MGKIRVNVRIDVKKILKDRLYAGAKGTYLDLSTLIDLDNKDQYENNGFISQSVTKEERDQGVQTPILGNCKVVWKEDQQNSGSSQQPARPENNGFTPRPGSLQQEPDDDSQIPF